LKSERLLPLLWLVLSFAVIAPTLGHPDHFASSYDWRLFETWLEAGRRSVVWYHQFPLWNAWTCGGQVYLANPQSLVATPTFLLVLAFGTALGIKLTLAAYFFCAFDGMYRLARSFEISAPSSILAACLLGTGGWFALHYGEGHCTFLGAALFPYAIYFYRRARDAWEWCIPLGFIAAWIVGDGGTSTPPMCIVILTTFACIDAAERRSPRPFLPLAIAALVAFLVGALRVLPALEFALDHPRHLFEVDTNPPWEVVRNAYWWKGIEPVGGKRYWFHEYGWRLPYLTIPLWIWSLRVKKARPIWIFAAVGFLVVLGRVHIGRFDLPTPWWFLHQLPIFRDLRVPSRYQIMLALAVPLLCAFALDDLRTRSFWRGWLTPVVIVVCLADGLAFDYVRFEKTFDIKPRLAEEGTPFYQIVGDWRGMMSNVLDNHGAIGCDEEAPLQRALKLDEGPMPQARVEDQSTGRVTKIDWTPNRVDLAVNMTASGVVSVNENWNEHWRAKLSSGDHAEVIRVGPKLGRDHDGGRLGANVPAGQFTVSFIYRPRSFSAGLWLSLLSIPLALAVFIWRGLRRR
jgi:hypothetical protein